MNIRQVHTNFTGGEIGPTLEGRSNLQAYQDGMSEIRNCRIMPQGGLRRRPGSVYCATLPTVTYQHEEYVFNSEQAYQFLLSDARLDIYDGYGNFVQTSTGLAWTAAMIGDLSVFSGGDYTFVCHPDLQVQQIKRTGATTFVVSTYAFETQLSGASAPVYQPYFKYAAATTTMKVDWVSYAGGGGYNSAIGFDPGTTVTLTTNVAFFTAAYVGLMLKVGTGQVEITAYTSSTVVTGVVRSKNIRVLLTENPITCYAGNSWLQFFIPFHAFTLGQYITVSMATSFHNLVSTDVNGTWPTVSVAANILSIDAAPASPSRTMQGGGDAAYYWAQSFTTPDWAEPTYSAVRGWPNCGGFHQTRMIFGGGKSFPNRLNFSQVEAPFNFDVGTGLDNESIQVSISSRYTPVIRHLVSDKHLQIFTSEGEFYAPFGLGNKPLTPGTISIFDQTTYGCTAGLKPARFDGSTLFVTKTLSAVRDMTFGSNDTGYTAPNVAFQAGHLLRTPRRLAALMEDVEQQEAVAYIVNGDDGSIATLTFARNEKISAWSLWTTNGLYKSACVVDRKLFYIVQRTVNGTTMTFLERMDHDAMLDCTVLSSGAPATDWPGYAHLADQSVDVVVNDTGYIGLRTVTGAGHVVLDDAATSVQAGFTFLPETLTLPPELNLPDGPTLGEPRRIVRVVIQLDNSVGVELSGNTFILRTALEDLTTSPTPAKNLAEFYLLGWDDKGQVRITAPTPVPFTMIGLMTEIEF
jgi:hypothetical protein